MGLSIVAVSDLHGTLPTDFPEGDILLIAGDICPVENHSLVHQLAWLNTKFRDWLSVQKEKYAVIAGCAGNHDFVYEQSPNTVAQLNLPWGYYQDSGFTYNGVNFHFSPHTPMFCDWAFNLPEELLAEKWALIPSNVNVLVTHGPPYGFRDTVVNHDAGRILAIKHIGSTTLAKRVLELTELKLHIFGHCHGDYGARKLDGMEFANVSILDEGYRYSNRPMVFNV